MGGLWLDHFFEFGTLTERIRKDGTAGNSQGQITVGIEFHWRAERENRVLFSSEDEKDIWHPTFENLVGQNPVNIELFGSLPELSISFESGLRVLSFTLLDNQPDWMIIDSRAGKKRSFGVENGALIQEDHD